jgi:hypothetical protein
MSNILREYRDYNSANIILEESKEVDPLGNKLMCMKGVFIQGDIRNQNQRIYPAREIVTAVNEMNKKLTSLNAIPIQGELDHPPELSINLDRVSHLITEMWLEGADGYGKLKIIPTPMGNIASTLLRYGAKLGVSSRGSGNVDDSGIVSDFEIITVDIVSQPSAPNAYPRVIYESLYNMKGGSRIIEDARDAHISKTAQKSTAKGLLRFINELKI